ncbi:MotE family protein [Chthonobacter albigriseus]|uniref:MotE family protein n=1 Tax=Chthonobacter albigriseus TaxID=1683161 RepID=UPI0015EEDD1E|nr:hypothetical protein [Chthonobacter albigriseus]
MKDIRLLPIVLFAVSALLVLKVLGMATGSGSFAVGPATAVAAGGGEHGEEAPAKTQGDNFDDPLILGPPIDLAREAEELAKQKAASGGHDAPAADAHGEAPAADAHGEAPAADAHGDAPAADAHGEAPAADAHAEAPAADGHAEAPAADAHAEAPAADGHAEAPAAANAEAPAAAAHGEAPAADGHGGGESTLPANVSTTRPEEFQPMKSQAELAIERSLSERRQTLDQREDDLTTRLKLLEAAEGRLQQRMEEMKGLKAAVDAQANAAPPGPSEQVRGLATMYENMKPKAAAAVFNKLELPILIELSRAMNPRKMSAILAVMDPERAGSLTTALAAYGMTVQVQAPPVTPDVPVASSQAAVPSDAQGLDALPKIMPAQ